MPVLLSDPRITAIPAKDNGEPLVDLRDAPELRLTTGLPGCLARQGLLARLREAQTALPGGVRLLIAEAYRAPAVQERYFAHYRGKLRAWHPDWTDERLRVEASKFVAPPEVAPHCTGGAVDLTLVTDDGAPLDLGTAMNANPEESEGACFTAAAISAIARRNRDLLGAALSGAGLVNYPTEWWHWSYGERYWAHTTGHPATIYGPVLTSEPDLP